VKRIVLFLLIFCLPFQLGYHFWLPQSFVASFRIDYLSPTLYLVDLLVLCYFALYHSTILKVTKSIFTGYPGLSFLVLLLINIYVSSGNPVTILAWARIIEYYYLFQLLCRENNLRTKIKLPFLLSLTLVLSLALLQFLNQSSLGGIFYYLGERPLSTAMSNVAKIGSLLRPYSTFSHPNSLAGYLLVVLVLLPMITKVKLFHRYTIAIIFLTLSKSAILALLLLEILHISLLWSFIITIFLSLLPLINSFLTLPSYIQISFSSRNYLFPPTLEVLKNSWFAGIGLRQFVPQLAKYLPGNQLSYLTLQPVHNVFLLIFTEIGFVGSAILMNIINHFKLSNPSRVKVISVLLLTGAVDHYWWTLPQNQLIIVLALALIVYDHELRRNHH